MSDRHEGESWSEAVLRQFKSMQVSNARSQEDIDKIIAAAVETSECETMKKHPGYVCKWPDEGCPCHTTEEA